MRHTHKWLDRLRYRLGADSCVPKEPSGGQNWAKLFAVALADKTVMRHFVKILCPFVGLLLLLVFTVHVLVVVVTLQQKRTIVCPKILVSVISWNKQTDLTS